jgi:hypothetical protein
MCESPVVFPTIFPGIAPGFLFVLKHSKIKQLDKQSFLRRGKSLRPAQQNPTINGSRRVTESM